MFEIKFKINIMKTFLLFLFISTGLMISAQNHITVYQHIDFKGDSEKLDKDWLGSNSLWDNQISAIKCPPGWKVMLYSEPNFSGNYLQIEGNWNAKENYEKWNETISSIKIISQPKNSTLEKPVSAYENFQITLYKGENFDGENRTITDSWSSHKYPDNVDWQAKIGSIRMSKGSIIRIYTLSHFKGGYKEFSNDFSVRDYPNLAKNIYSIKVIKKGNNKIVIPTKKSIPTLISGNVTLFKGENLDGESKIITNNWNPTSSDERINWGGKTGSIKISEGWGIRVYTLTGYRGSYADFSSSFSVKDFPGLKGNIASIKIIQKGKMFISGIPISTGVKIFKGSNFNGQNKYITKNWSANSYPENVDWGGKINSIEVPEGWGIRAYKLDGYRGSFIDITGNWSSFENSDWKDKISSIKIMTKPNYNIE